MPTALFNASQAYGANETFSGNLASIGDNDVGTVSFSGKFEPGRPYWAWCPSLTAGMFICRVDCTTAGTLVVHVANMSGGVVDEVARDFFIIGF